MTQKLLKFCPTPGCDGSGHANGSFLTHRSLSGCPRATQVMKKAKLSNEEMTSLQLKAQSGAVNIEDDLDMRTLNEEVETLGVNNVKIENTMIKLRTEITVLDSKVAVCEKERKAIEENNRSMNEYLESLKASLIQKLSAADLPGVADKITKDNFDEYIAKLRNMCLDNYTPENHALYCAVKAALADIPVA